MRKSIICALLICASGYAHAKAIKVTDEWQFEPELCRASWLGGADWMKIDHVSKPYLTITVLTADTVRTSGKWRHESMLTEFEGNNSRKNYLNGSGRNEIGFADFADLPVGWLEFAEGSTAFSISSRSMKPLRVKGEGFAKVAALLRGCYYDRDTKTLTIVRPPVVRARTYTPAPMVRPIEPTKQNQSRRAVSPSQRAQ